MNSGLLNTEEFTYRVSQASVCLVPLAETYRLTQICNCRNFVIGHWNWIVNGFLLGNNVYIQKILNVRLLLSHNRWEQVWISELNLSLMN